MYASHAMRDNAAFLDGTCVRGALLTKRTAQCLRFAASRDVPVALLFYWRHFGRGALRALLGRQ